MKRRDFLQCAALLVSGMAAGRAGITLSAEQRHLMNAINYAATPVVFFTAQQRATVAAAAEQIIPATDTPGAIDASVPRFIELMVADWLNAEERALFMNGLEVLIQRSRDLGGEDFSSLDHADQLALLEALEEEAGDAQWYAYGSTLREFDSTAPFICQLKELTIWGFFTSEVGATQVLRYNAMPMRFDGEVPLARDDSAWAGLQY